MESLPKLYNSRACTDSTVNIRSMVVIDLIPVELSPTLLEAVASVFVMQ